MRIVPKILLFLIVIFLPANVFAAYEIYTYGTGDFVASTFNAIKMLFAENSMYGLIKMFLILVFVNIFLAIFFGIMGRSTAIGGDQGVDPIQTAGAGIGAMIKTAISAVIVVYALAGIKADVNIIDRVDPTQTQAVDNVPFINAIVASWSSIIGDKIGELLEDTITPPEAPKVRTDGFLIGPKYTNEILDLMPPGAPSEYVTGAGNIPIKVVLDMWFERCIIPNFAYIAGESSVEAQGLFDLRHSGYLLNAWNNSRFRNPVIELPIEITQGQPLNCYTAPEWIIMSWNSIFDKWADTESRRIFGEGTVLETPVDKLEKAYNRYFMGHFTAGFSESIAQIALINMFRSSMIAYDAKYGPGNLKDQLAESQTGSGWIQAARLFGKIVIIMRQLFEALIYGLSVFLPVAFIVGGYRALVTWAKINFWLQLWVPGFIMINAFADYKLTDLVNQIWQAGIDEGFSFATIEKFRTQANLMMGYIGAFMWSVPTLAWGLVRGSEYAMTTAISAVGGRGETATQVGAQLGGAGNVSVGTQAYGGTRFIGETATGSFAGGMRSTMDGAALRSAMGVMGVGQVDSAFKNAVFHSISKNAALGTKEDSAGIGATEGISQKAEAAFTGEGFNAVKKAFGLKTDQEAANFLKFTGIKMTGRTQDGDYVFEGNKTGLIPGGFALNNNGNFKMFRFDDPIMQSKFSEGVKRSHTVGTVMADSKFKETLEARTHEAVFGQKGTFDESFSEALRNDFAKNFTEELKKNSRVLEQRGIKINDQAQWIRGADGSLALNVGGGLEKITPGFLKKIFSPGGKVGGNVRDTKLHTVEGQTGSSTDVGLSTDIQNVIKTAYDKALDKTVKTSFVTESGYRNLHQWANKEGGLVRDTFEKASKRAEEQSKDASVDMTGAFLNQFVEKVYGKSTPENYIEAIQNLRKLVAEGKSDEALKMVGIDFAPHATESNIDKQIEAKKEGIENYINQIEKKFKNSGYANPSGNPRSVPMAIDPQKLKEPDFIELKKQMKEFQDYMENVTDKQAFFQNNTWVLNQVDKLNGIIPGLGDAIAPNVAKNRSIIAPITKIPSEQREDRGEKLVERE